jgi:protein phosphatase
VQTHVGKQRTENQDRVTRAATPFGDLFVVADGVGGYRGGAEAAQTVADGFAAFLSGHGQLTLQQAIQQAVRRVSGDLLKRAASDPSLQRMGSTVVLCVIRDNRLTYAHAGDSRAYLVRDGHLCQLTRDHSVMERLTAQGMLTPEEARQHPDASVLTRAIGQSADISLDIGEIELQPGDCVLLCSDGLWAYARELEMEAIAVSTSLSPAAVASALLNLALEGGGGDNISIQFLRFSAIAPARRMATLLGLPLKTVVPVVGLAAIIAVGTTGMFLWNRNHPVDNPAREADRTAVQPEAAPAAPAPAKSIQPAPPSAPAAKKPAPAVPAGVPAHPASKAAPNPAPVKIRVVIVKDANGQQVPWAGKLTSLPNSTTETVGGEDACLRKRPAKDTLFYAEPRTDLAKKVQASIPPQQRPEIASMSRGDQAACPNADLIVMPGSSRANPSVLENLNQIKAKAKETLQAGKQKAEEIKDEAPLPKPTPQP